MRTRWSNDWTCAGKSGIANINDFWNETRFWIMLAWVVLISTCINPIFRGIEIRSKQGIKPNEAGPDFSLHQNSLEIALKLLFSCFDEWFRGCAAIMAVILFSLFSQCACLDRNQRSMGLGALWRFDNFISSWEWAFLALCCDTLQGPVRPLREAAGFQAPNTDVDQMKGLAILLSTGYPCKYLWLAKILDASQQKPIDQTKMAISMYNITRIWICGERNLVDNPTSCRLESFISNLANAKRHRRTPCPSIKAQGFPQTSTPTRDRENKLFRLHFIGYGMIKSIVCFWSKYRFPVTLFSSRDSVLQLLDKVYDFFWKCL